MPVKNITGIERRTTTNGSKPLKPETAIVTPATGLEERMMPLINCKGEIMNAAFAPTVKAASGIIGAKLKKEALPEPVTKAAKATIKTMAV